jgi:L-methionine (R)-S-oxide reductase
MLREAVNNLNSAEAHRTDDFEILGQVFLDPISKDRSHFWIGLFEQVSAQDLCRVFRGPMDLESSSIVSWKEPISFDGKTLGFLEIKEDRSSAFTENDTKTFHTLAQQIAPLFAWQEIPWASKLKILKVIFNLSRRHKYFHWTGIYRLEPLRRDSLLLSTFLGLPTEHFRIPISKGICGAAVREERTINIPNVQSDPRFIACSLTTQSEVVVPIRNSKNEVVAEIDIDSDELEAFTPERVADVEAAAIEIGEILEYPA